MVGLTLWVQGHCAVLELMEWCIVVLVNTEVLLLQSLKLILMRVRNLHEPLQLGF